MKKLSLINGEPPEAENAQEPKGDLQRLSEKAPLEKEVEAIVRPTAITKRNGRDKQK